MEGAPNQESMERAALVEVLRTRGFEDRETMELLILWTAKQESEVERLGTREAQVSFEINRAELYLEAGFVEDGKQALEDALMIAFNERLDELADTIEEKLDALQ